ERPRHLTQNIALKRPSAGAWLERMVRWRDLLRAAEPPAADAADPPKAAPAPHAAPAAHGANGDAEEDDDLPPLVSHEPVLTADAWVDPEPNDPDPQDAPTSRQEEPEAQEVPEEEEEEEEEEISESEEEEEEAEPVVFEQPPLERIERPEPEGIAAGPWRAGHFEFFAAFDSGNLANARLVLPEEEAAPSAEDADVVWAAQPESRLLYKLAKTCAVRTEPSAKAKLITKKSAGARLYANCRQTLHGWQKLADEEGWAQLSAPAEGGEVKRFTPPNAGDAEVEVAEGAEQKLPAANGASSEARGGYPAPAPSSLELTFEVTARADCAGTDFASEECQWFHFGLRADAENGDAVPVLQAGQLLRFRVLGLSRFRRLETTRVSGQLLTDGLQPVVSEDGRWRLVEGDIGMLRTQAGMAFTFEHRVERPCKELRFALTFPYPLGRIWSHLAEVTERLVAKGNYVAREVLCSSLGGLPIELLTITHCSDRHTERLPGLDQEGKGDASDARPWIFPKRRAVFVSARVHPGETPASYMLEGLLDFLASGTAAAQELLRRFVFFILPVLNPDGVACGHHRLDLRAENLNRVYGKASWEDHPSVVAAEKACLRAHRHQGLRLYLDLHAHSNRRGGFLLADAGSDAKSLAEAKLFGWALGRRCEVFEFAQSDFSESKRGTGKSFMAKATGNPLCFTVECHYIRG
ncbi:unnamed protein product, partial [Effrenium voratum]